jgi:hypothetical protein
VLGLIPHEKLPRKNVQLPERSTRDTYDDRAALEGRRFVKPRYLLCRSFAAAWTGSAVTPV